MPAHVSASGAVSLHPCFSAEAGRRHGRIHLPVAPTCNIQCAYCNRAYDCVNESRPGVASRVMEPEEAAARLDEALAHMPFITVAGIAGPGDPFSEPAKTLATLELIRRAHPKLQLCLSSNGLNVCDYIGALSELKVGFVTITVNAVDPMVGAKIYTRIGVRDSRLHGAAAVELLLDSQMDALRMLKARGFAVKVNTVVIPGVNDFHVPAVAEKISRLKVDLHNLIGMIPVAGTSFQHIPPPSADLMRSLRDAAGVHVPQMRHCARCRSDAAGLLHHDQSCKGNPRAAEPFRGAA